MQHAGYTEALEEIKARLEGQLAEEGLTEEIEPTEDALYLGTPAGGSDSEGIDLPEAGVNATAEEDAETGEAESPAVLTDDDIDLIETIKARGWAATLEEAGHPDHETIERLADNGAAFLRRSTPATGAPHGEIVLAMAGGTEGDVRRAGYRAAADNLIASFEADTATCGGIRSEVLARTARLGEVAAEAGLYAALAGDASFSREAITATLRRMAEAGEIRRVRSRRSQATFLASPRTSKQALRERVEAHQHNEARSEAVAAAKAKRGTMAEPISAGYPTIPPLKPNVEEYTGGVKELYYGRVLPRLKEIEPKLKGVKLHTAYRIIEAARLPFHVTPQDAGWESKATLEKRAANRKRIRGEYIARRREGRPLAIRPAAEITAGRWSRRVRAKARRRARVSAISRRARANPEKVARDTARAATRVALIALAQESPATIPVFFADGLVPATVAA